MITGEHDARAQRPWAGGQRQGTDPPSQPATPARQQIKRLIKASQEYDAEARELERAMREHQREADAQRQTLGLAKTQLTKGSSRGKGRHSDVTAKAAEMMIEWHTTQRLSLEARWAAITNQRHELYKLIERLPSQDARSIAQLRSSGAPWSRIAAAMHMSERHAQRHMATAINAMALMIEKTPAAKRTAGQ